MKRCPICGKEGGAESFHKNKSAKDGLYAICKECTKKANRKYYLKNKDMILSRNAKSKNRFKTALVQSALYAKKNGHTACTATVQELQLAFTGSCAICGIDESECNNKLSVDHDHDSGTFRGFLCYKCNTGLGYFGDSADLVFRAFEFLSHSKIGEDN